MVLTLSSSPWKPSITPPISSVSLSFIATPPRLSTFSCLSSKLPRSSAATFRVSGIPARDRVVDFGKFKGKMLGSLPSAYLKWVSKNLRAGDTEEWAKMADEVLDDAVYRDRIEWEAAEKILNGDTASHCSSGKGRNAVSELLEISERFGWDNEDKRGWSMVDFGLLGTSKGGRIPRVDAGRSNEVITKKTKVENVTEGGERRSQRRDRVKRLSRRPERKQQEVDEDGDGGSGEVVKSPFPGREALLKKVLNRQRL